MYVRVLGMTDYKPTFQIIFKRHFSGMYSKSKSLPFLYCELYFDFATALMEE